MRFTFLLAIFIILAIQGNAQGGKAILIRGPYVQMVGEDKATIRWRTSRPTDSKVSVGEKHGEYLISATSSERTTEHEVQVNGLLPGTKYFYQFGSTTHVIQKGRQNFFVTAPSPASVEKVKIAVFGDCGRNYMDYQVTTLRAYRKFVGEHPAQLMLLLGDNAYYEGTDRQYQRRFFNIYGRNILKHHALFPAPGNHEYYSGTPTSRDIAYYKSFTMPANGELGGVPSGTESYYSFNWGNIHFVSLDSYGMEDNGTTRVFDTLGAQVSWLKKDLEANKQKWTIVYFHHPPYSKGSHNSEWESDLINIRTNLNPILERYGVDLVMTGHSHNYERSYLLRNHYGKEASFDKTLHAASASSAKYDESDNSCPYTTSGQAYGGTVYVVSGSSGAGGRIQQGYPHQAMPFSMKDGGMFFLEIEDNRLDAKFLRRNGKIGDQFTMLKEVNKTTHVIMQQGFSVNLTASWPGSYCWSTGDTARTITVTPRIDTVITVNDQACCVKDTFRITVHKSNYPPAKEAAEPQQSKGAGEKPFAEAIHSKNLLMRKYRTTK